jgi:hypothetical protein
MAVYNLEIPYFVVNNPRSGGLLGDEDTLFATTGLVVNDAQGGIYQQYGGKTMELRDRGQGSIVSTGLRYAGVDVPDGGKIHWTFTLMNTGHGDIAFIGALTNLSDQFSRALAANTINGQEADNAGTNVLQYLGNFPFPDAVVQAVLNKLVNICDGVVVDAVIERTAAQLADMTAANGIWEDKRNHPGGDSPPGCGGNSNYDVVYGISLRDAALPWSGEEDLGGILTSAPAVASWGLNRLDCFARGLNNHMWHRSWGGNGWTNWEDLGGILTSSPAVASWGLNRLDCFYRGQNNHLWHRWYDGHWSNEQDLGGFLNSDPAVASWEPNRLDIFYKGPNNTIKVRTTRCCTAGGMATPGTTGTTTSAAIWSRVRQWRHGGQTGSTASTSVRGTQCGTARTTAGGRTKKTLAVALSIVQRRRRGGRTGSTASTPVRNSPWCTAGGTAMRGAAKKTLAVRSPPVQRWRRGGHQARHGPRAASIASTAVTMITCCIAGSLIGNQSGADWSIGVGSPGAGPGSPSRSADCERIPASTSASSAPACHSRQAVLMAAGLRVLAIGLRQR